MRKLTYALLLLLIGSLTGSEAAQQDPNIDRATKAKRAFPVADINETDSDSTSAKGRSKQLKRQRYDAFEMVASKPQPWIAERVASPEGFFNFSALPVTQSDIILVAVVSKAEAHVSSNKKGIFSEFDLTVESVLKSSQQDIKEGSNLTADRIGGWVKYPDGQQILFRVNGLNMPQVRSRYLFFVSARKKPDFLILTAYELTSNGVIPLDNPAQFQSLEGITETELQNRVRALLTK
jgi:hypothetical protein